jgi:enterobacteria phage integrase
MRAKYREPFASVIHAYRLSPRYLKLRPRSRVSYDYGLLIAERSEIGRTPVGILEPPLMAAFLDTFADRPTTQRNILKAFRVLDKWAYGRGLLPNLLTVGYDAPGGSGHHKAWPDEMIALAETHARADLSRAVTLGINTGQRVSDLVRMQWQHIRDRNGIVGIDVKQQKTNRELWIPLTRELIDALRTWDRSLGYLITKPTGEPYRSQQLSETWNYERAHNPALAPLLAAGLTFHGLRASAVGRLLRAGNKAENIADFVGMGMHTVAIYCKGFTQEERAIAALNKMQGSTNVMMFPTRTKEKPGS